MKCPALYRTTNIDGLSIFYSEAGPEDAAKLHLLHGLPSFCIGRGNKPNAKILVDALME